MTNANLQVVNMYENLGLTPEQVAAQLDLDLVSVKSVLLQFSGVYKSMYKEAVKEGQGNKYVTEMELEEMYSIVKQVARYDESGATRAKCAMFVIDDARGRRDKAKDERDFLKEKNINVVVFNEKLSQTRQAIARNKNRNVIDLVPTVTENEKAIQKEEYAI